jgi:hypothetical protein
MFSTHELDQIQKVQDIDDLISKAHTRGQFWYIERGQNETDSEITYAQFVGASDVIRPIEYQDRNAIAETVGNIGLKVGSKHLILANRDQCQLPNEPCPDQRSSAIFFRCLVATS